MLRHLQIVPKTVAVKSSAPMKHAPFSPEEIAQAVADIEQERQGMTAERDAETQLSSVLHQLQLDIPATEVAERIQRIRQLCAGKTRSLRRRREVLLATGSFITICIAVGICFWGWSQQGWFEPRETLTPRPKLLVAEQVGKDTVMKTFAEVPDGKWVSVSGDQFAALLGVKGTETVKETFRPQNRWTAFRKNGRYYVRGFTAVRLTTGALRTNPTLAIYNNRVSQGTFGGEVLARVPVTFSLDSVSPQRSIMGKIAEYHQLEMRVVHPDGVVFGD